MTTSYSPIVPCNMPSLIAGYLIHQTLSIFSSNHIVHIIQETGFVSNFMAFNPTKNLSTHQIINIYGSIEWF